MLRRIVCWGFFFLLGVSGLSADLRESMSRDLDHIWNTLEGGYTPAHWKGSLFDWSLEEQVREAREAIQENPDLRLRDYHRILKRVFLSTQDYHVRVGFNATESASLPFQVVHAEGRYFLGYVDRDKAPYAAFPFFEGDEVIAFGGRPIGEVVDELVETEVMRGREETARAIALQILTLRSAASGLVVPRGGIDVTLSSFLGEQKTVQLAWDYTPEKLLNRGLLSDGIVNQRKKALKEYFQIKEEDLQQAKKLNLGSLERQMFAERPVNFFDHVDGQIENPHEIGTSRSFLPRLGTVVWEGKSPFFDAYLFQDQDKRLIGYVRIPHFSSMGMGNWLVRDFGEILSHFERVSEALVIDQYHNPGGSAFFLYGILSMLTEQPLEAPKHEALIDPDEVSQMMALLEELEEVNIQSNAELESLFGGEIDGFSIDMNFVHLLKEYCRKYIDAWQAGSWKVEDLHVYGVDKINPHPLIRYTKPILLLVDELDFSCGDFFPAILQDNQRARIFGANTAGAGGWVVQTSYPNRFAVDYIRYTGSLAWRPNGQPLENLGVAPDVSYQMTVEDRKQNYAPLKRKILNEIDSLISGR